VLSSSDLIYTGSLDTESEEGITYTVLVSLPPTYPASSPPQLQLLSRYIGPFSVDSALWGAILRTYISKEGVEWVDNSVCVFDGLEWVKERCAAWYGARKSEKLAGQLLRQDARSYATTEIPEESNKNTSEFDERQPKERPPAVPVGIPAGVQIVEAEPITDRRSSFVGRACRITDPSQVKRISLQSSAPSFLIAIH
jgi:hypothetical protein